MILRIFRRTWKIIITVIIIYIIFLLIRNRQQITDRIFRIIRQFLYGIKNALNNLLPKKVHDIMPINVFNVIIANLTQNIL